MKKKFAGLLVALLVLAMGITALAAESPDKDSQIANGVSSPDKNVTITKPSEQVVASANSQAAKILGAGADVLKVLDLEYNGKFPATIRLNYAGVKKGDNIVLLHQKKDGTWETITPSVVGDGYFVAEFTELSPVAIVKVGTAPAGTPDKNGTKPAGVNTSGKSPKTGSAFPVLPVLAVICAAGIAVCGKKVIYNA